DAPQAIVLCAHAAPNIAMGRVLTGEPDRDVKVGTCSISTYKRKQPYVHPAVAPKDGEVVPWKGRGVVGGWEQTVNGDCSFLELGEERNWWFDGDEDWDFAVVPPAEVVGAAGAEGSGMGEF